MNATKTAVRHQDHNIAIAMLPDNGRNDVVVVRNVPCVAASSGQIGDESIRIQTLRFRQRGPEHRCDNDFVGGAERGGKCFLKDAPAGRGGTRLEDRPDPAIRIAAPQRGQRLEHSRRVVGEVIQDGDAASDADHLQPPLDSLERAQSPRHLVGPESGPGADGNRGERIANIVDAEQRRVERPVRFAPPPDVEVRDAIARAQV